MEDDKKTMLHIQNLEARFGAFRLGPIDMAISKGEYRIILGATGSGKTALMETIAGLNSPSGGKIVIDGEDVTTLPPEKRNVGMVYQDYALFPHMSVWRNISFGLKMQGHPPKQIRDKVAEIAKLLGLSRLLSRKPRNLSGGERQRAAIARALVLEPRILLLDEPTSALDRHTRTRLREELRHIHERLGLTVLHITHNLDEAFLLGDRISIMKNGRILQEGTGREITEAPAHKSAAALAGINNFIPAAVDERGEIILHCKIPHSPMRFIPHPPAGSKILLTVPDWAVAIGNMTPGHDTLFSADATVKEIISTPGGIKVRLELCDKTQIISFFSSREIKASLSNLKIGQKTTCHIRVTGTHWVADPDATHK